MRAQTAYYIPIALFLFLTLGWMFSYLFPVSQTGALRHIWGALLPILALYAALYGFRATNRWGGSGSTLGKTIFVFSLGLFLQGLGQIVRNYYIFSFHTELLPYPTMSDIEFFGSFIFYTIGVGLLSKVSGAFVTLQRPLIKFLKIIIPAALIVFISIYFFNVYEFDWSKPFKIILDLGYPLVGISCISLTLLILIRSRIVLGGVMKQPIIFVFFALIFQFIADFMFLFETIQGSRYVGGIGDFLYLISYFFMAISIIQMSIMFGHAKSSSI